MSVEAMVGQAGDTPEGWRVRDETPDDASAIGALITQAFRDVPYASGTEALIVEQLRARGELTLSLLAEANGEVIAHAGFSPVIVGASAAGWYGLGPVATTAAWRRHGLAEVLIRTGLVRLRALGAAGCVVLGDPSYYTRFGFGVDPSIRYPHAPAAYFMALRFQAGADEGEVRYSPAFDAGR